MNTEQTTTPPEIADACRVLVAAAVRLAAYSHTAVPPPYFQQIRHAIDSGEAALTVQVDLPSGEVRVLADGAGWVAPQCLLRLELAEAGQELSPE